MITALKVLAIAYNVWVLLIFAFAKFGVIIKDSDRLSALDDKLMRLLKSERS